MKEQEKDNYPDVPDIDYGDISRELGSETVRQWSDRIIGVEAVKLITGGMEFFGQEAIKTQIEPFIDRTEMFPNTLILGRPGIGKTRLAKWIASQRYEPFEEFLCPVSPDLLPTSGIIMLDEAHRQKHPEWLWEIMSSEHSTVMAATTRADLLEPAFTSRFMLTLHLKKYTEEAMTEMGLSILPMNNDSISLYAGASAGNPRQLELILAVAKELGPENHEAVLRACRITADGLTEYHINILQALKKAGRPVGLSLLASMMYSDEQSLRDYERMLVDLDFISQQSNGRVLTRDGAKYLERVSG